VRQRGISTVIICRNEVERLERCVRSVLPFSDEVLVVDAESTDGTRKLAESLGCRVVVNPWPGYAAQRNLGAEAAANDWIFSIDSDEAADEELSGAIEGLGAGGSAFSVRRINRFMGAWLTGRPELKVRLYDRRSARFEDSAVHEIVDVPVKATGTLPGFVWHDSHRDLDDATRRLNTYTSLEAEQAAAKRRMRPWRVLLRPLLRFVQRYVWERSYRHGWAGLFYALHWSYWELLREMKVYERRRRS
jgi:glycosyltransferase involved in cell wall biosynthesis